MKILIASVAIASAGLFAAVSAQAMPVAPLPQNELAIINVMDACGPYRHRGPFGHCRPRYSCPPGWHSGPHGWRCFRN